MNYNNKRLLYLIKHTNNLMFKIGIATDYSRFTQLHKIYQIDWSASFYFQGENQDITKLEKILHKLFFKFNLGLDKQDGYTEWFSIDCLDAVIEAIKFNTRNSNYVINLDSCNIELSFEKEKELNLMETTNSWIDNKEYIFSKYPLMLVNKWKQLDSLKPTQKRVNEMNKLIPEFRVFLKPSELCQVLFFDESNKGLTVSPLQVDLINNFYYEIRKRIVMDNIEIPSDGSTVFEFQLKEICDVLGKYNNSQYTHLIEQLDSLGDIKMVINSLGKNKEIEELTITKFLQEIKISKHKKTEIKKVKITMSNTLINTFLQTDRFFAKMFLMIQMKMSSKYSKLLYELLKDYEGIKKITFNYHTLLDLLNVTNESQKKWMMFNQNILKKSIMEINEKSDIFIKSTAIKEKENGERLQVTKIKFFIEKQDDSKLKELGLIQESIKDNKFYNKSKSKLDKLVKGGYKVIDEEMWIGTDIKKNEKHYESEIRIDKWLKETSENDKNFIYETIAKYIDDCEDPMIVIEDYKILGLFSKYAFTKNPLETIELLNQTISNIEQ